MRVLTNVDRGLKMYIRTGTWDIEIVSTEMTPEAYKMPPNPKIVVDIGAHIGGTSILAASMGAKVWAYEPEPSNFKMLTDNIALNNLQDKITPIMLAVGAKTETRDLHLNSHNFGGFGFYAPTEETTTVNVIGINEVMATVGEIDVLKVDCEGGEYEIFSTIDPKYYEQINQISLELHFAHGFQPSELVEKFGVTYAEDLVKRLGNYYPMILRSPSGAKSAEFCIFNKRE